MEQTTEETPLYNEASLFQDPAHLAFLMGHIGKKTFKGTIRSPYKPTPRKPHILDESQTKSFGFLKEWAQELPEGFTFRELKAAFRKAALRLHPDQGGNCGDFLSLKGHYLNLQSIFLSK